MSTPLHTLNHGMLIKVEGATLRTMHTPGHSPGHAAFYILEDGDLISGDTVLGYGTTFFEICMITCKVCVPCLPLTQATSAWTWPPCARCLRLC